MGVGVGGGRWGLGSEFFSRRDSDEAEAERVPDNVRSIAFVKIWFARSV